VLFNSLIFLLFFPVVFVLYWFVVQRSLRIQNFLILVASYVFYGWWDYRFLALIALSTIVDYTLGLAIERQGKTKKAAVYKYLSLAFNLGVLAYFKYFNFFVESFVDAFSNVGFQLEGSLINIILPVGISFYTFQTLSYTLDVYNQKIKATKDFVAFAAFVSFFPQLVAGPIERASNLLPQMLKKRHFDFNQAMAGIDLILWGFFKKVVIADNLAPTVNEIFGNHTTYAPSVLLLGAIYFSFQIYCDFSGYSNIARGLAKLLGFELMINFKFPYFSRSIGEFWRRWHISLSTWFRDYLYIPLGGSRNGKWGSLRNIFIIFIVSGFWHGANWTFLIWGAIHALLYVPSFLMGTNRAHLGELLKDNQWLPSATDFIRILATFLVVMIAWVFFRAENLSHALSYLGGMFDFGSDKVHSILNPYDNQSLFKENLILIAFIIIDYLIYSNRLSGFYSKELCRIPLQAALLCLILINMPIGSDLSFIYFQF